MTTIKKLNFHESKLADYHTSLLYNFLNPFNALRTRMELHYMRRYAGELQDLGGEIHRFDAAREIHERLAKLLGHEGKRTFFDLPREEIKEFAPAQGEMMVEEGAR
jgi:hypothetical protein